MKIAILSASVRAGRVSHRIALMLERHIAKSGHEPILIDLQEAPLPPLDFVLDRSPAPNAAYLAIKQAIKSADAVLFVSPEYNGSYTANLKNLVDHLGKLDFAKKVIGISSVTTGPLGGMRAALAMQELVLAVWGIALPQMLLVPLADKKIDADGHIIEETFNNTVNNYLKEFFWLAEAVVAKKEQEVITLKA